MRIRNYIFFFLIVLLPKTLQSQNFVTLDWKNPAPVYIGDSIVKTDIPGFAGAHYSPDENYLPHYLYQINLGKDYASYEYEVKVEYPEFQPLSGKELSALLKSGFKLHNYPEVDTHLSVSAKEGILDIDFIPLVYREGTYQRISSFKLKIDKKALPPQVLTRASAEERYAAASVLADGKWVKIRVSETGVYKITHSELNKMGFSNPSKVRLYGYGGFILPEDVMKPKIDDLQQVPLWRESNYVLFYANGTIKWEKQGDNYVHTQNHYSTHAYYFLTENDSSPMEFPKEDSLSEEGAEVITTFPDYALEEKELFSWFHGGRKLYDDYDYKLGDTKVYQFNLPGITNEDGTVTVAFSAHSTSKTTLTVSAGNVTLGDMGIASSGQYSRAQDSSKTHTWIGDKQEKTSIILKHTRPSGVSGRLDFIRLNFKRKLALYGSFTNFRSGRSDKSKYVVENVNENTYIWNVGDPPNYKQIQGKLSGSQYTFVSDGSEHVAVNVTGTFNKVEVVGTIANQNLHSLSNIDMVVIVPPNQSLLTQANRLAEIHRQKDNLTVQVVTSEQIYNEFSSGTPDGTAYRWFMKMLYDRAETDENRPKYLLLFGDGAYDNRMLSSDWRRLNPQDFLLCFVSDDSLSETDSYVLDDYYGLLDDGEGVDLKKDKVDIGIGRIPVRNVTEAKQVVDKIIDYINNKHIGPWKNTVCVLGDDGIESDAENGHMKQAEDVAKYIEENNPEYLVKRIYWDAYKMEKTSTGDSYPEVTKRLMELFNEGMLVMNYTGHGSPIAFSHEYSLTPAHIQKITSTRPPLWITAACDITPFDAIDNSMGEIAFLHPKGGAIALYSTTRTVYSDKNAIMNNCFIKHLFPKENSEVLRLGDVVRLTKVEMGNASVNNLHYVFIGDPAMRLINAEYKVIVDEMNGKPAEETPTIKAGGIVSVKGRIVNESGQTATDFNGTVYPTVLDSKENIVTYNNNGFAKQPFSFESRDKILFTGSNSVTEGNFSFTFPVPMDINYSNKEGMMNLYAIEESTNQQGQGYFDKFLIGGTEDGATQTDSLGPDIKAIYLNTPDFVYGGKVNETPYLVVELEDPDGINAVGNGIGHDLIAIIDNSPLYTYVLNNYYESYKDDYTKGRVRYSLPTLLEGKHRLLFRAWDIKNNSSTATLEFEVVKGLKPEVIDIDCTQSPAREETTFILTHNRPESELDIRVAVYDFSGKELWVHEESGISTGNYYYIPWNLTTSGGQRVSPGMYLFRASISSDGSKENTKARKIVILAQ